MKRSHLRRRGGFTLIEMLIVLAIIAILASLTYGAYWRAQGTARDAKTKATIAKLHGLMMARWESFQGRRVNVSMSGLTNPTPNDIALRRLMAIRELQRMELPDHFADITTAPTTFLFATGTDSSLRVAYKRKLDAITTESTAWQSAECLYLILTTNAGDESLTGQEFSNVDIGDYDKDGLKEFLDGWGKPILFVRWPTGLISDLQPRGANGQPDPKANPDPLDVRKLDRRPFRTSSGTTNTYTPQALFNPSGTYSAYATFPLIYSMGPDGIEDTFHAVGAAGFDPYFDLTIGQPADLASENSTPPNNQLDHWDNISNHALPVRQ